MNEHGVSGPVNPLTGETVSEDASELRPYCVMINNHPAARPAIGLSQASIVYEALAEGGLTRMMAIFTDVDEITTYGYDKSDEEVKQNCSENGRGLYCATLIARNGWKIPRSYKF